MIADDTPLGQLRLALQNFIQSLEDESVMLDVAVVVWEQTTLEANGEVARRVSWAIPTDNFSMSSAFGLMALGHEYMARELLEGD